MTGNSPNMAFSGDHLMPGSGNGWESTDLMDGGVENGIPSAPQPYQDRLPGTWGGDEGAGYFSATTELQHQQESASYDQHGSGSYDQQLGSGSYEQNVPLDVPQHGSTDQAAYYAYPQDAENSTSAGAQQDPSAHAEPHAPKSELEMQLEALKIQQMQYHAWLVQYLASVAASAFSQGWASVHNEDGAQQGGDASDALYAIYASASGRSYLHYLKVHPQHLDPRPI